MSSPSGMKYSFNNCFPQLLLQQFQTLVVLPFFTYRRWAKMKESQSSPSKACSFLRVTSEPSQDLGGLLGHHVPPLALPVLPNRPIYSWATL